MAEIEHFLTGSALLLLHGLALPHILTLWVRALRELREELRKAGK